MICFANIEEIEVDKLPLESNSLLIFRAKERPKNDIIQAMQGLSDTIVKRGFVNVILLHLEPGTTLETMSEKEMFEIGWVRRKV